MENSDISHAEFVSRFSHEVQVLDRLLPLVKGPTDYLILHVVVAQFAIKRLTAMGSWKRIDTLHAQFVINTLINLRNQLSALHAEQFRMGWFNQQTCLSDSILGDFNIRGKKKVDTLVKECQKVQGQHLPSIMAIANNCLNNLILTTALGLQGLSEDSFSDVFKAYSSSVGLENPYFFLLLPPEIIEKISRLEKSNLRQPWKVNSPTGLTPIALDIDLIIANAFFEFGKLTLKAVREKNVSAIDEARQFLNKFIAFCSDQTQHPPPQKDIITIHDNLNLQTVAAMMRASGGYQVVGTSQTVAFSLPNDVFRRVFEICFPSEYAFFSNQPGIISASEYAQNPAAFFVTHAADAKSSIRVQSLERTRELLNQMKLNFIVNDATQKVLQQAESTTNFLKSKGVEPAVAGGVTYIITSALKHDHAITDAATVALADLICNVFVKKERADYQASETHE